LLDHGRAKEDLQRVTLKKRKVSQRLAREGTSGCHSARAATSRGGELTAIEHPAVEDLVVKDSNSGNAEILTPWSRRASVTLKSGGSKVLSWAETNATMPNARAAVYEEKSILAERVKPRDRKKKGVERTASAGDLIFAQQSTRSEQHWDREGKSKVLRRLTAAQHASCGVCFIWPRG
jgi:hypothetical protein